MNVAATSTLEAARRPGRRLAIVTSHPIQYYAPWFRHVAAQEAVQLRVFFLFEPAREGLFDRGFGQNVQWDTPLLDGYDYEFVPNSSKAPGTHHFGGLENPQLAVRLRAFGPAAVLLVGYNYRSLIGLVLTWPTRKIPLILRGDSHRLVPEGAWRGRLKAAALSLLFRRFSAFLFVGAANRRYFELHGVEAARLFHAPHAVDNARFMGDQAHVGEDALAWRRELGIGDERLVVLFAGKFEQKKRPLDLLRAFLGLRSKQSTLLFVGAGELEGALRAEANGHPDVVFAPFQNQSQMPRTYAVCDVLVLPSYGRYETWGLAVNEAMCLGKPAIVSSHVGCAEDLVLPGRTGLVFAAGDVGALGAALEQALADPGRLRDWGGQAREVVRQFSYEAASAGLLEAFDHVTRGKGCSSGSEGHAA